MEFEFEKMESQLWDWRLRIDRLAIETHKAGGGAGFDATMRVDELKALHAIAQARHHEFWAVGDLKRLRLIPDLEGAWNNLLAAFADPGR
ncbi:MAG: hypothetical protein C0395_06095 [Gemmatimonas sp.]|nr:hypothetical protein [Gemmatimonas sp.]